MQFTLSFLPKGVQLYYGEIQKKTLEAAKAMKLSSNDLLQLNIIDEIIPEPIGGAHRNPETTIKNCEKVLLKYLEEFNNYAPEEILEQRKNKFLNIGTQKSFNIFLKDSEWINKEKILQKFEYILLKYKKKIILTFFLIVCAVFFFIIK